MGHSGRPNFRGPGSKDSNNLSILNETGPSSSDFRPDPDPDGLINLSDSMAQPIGPNSSWPSLLNCSLADNVTDVTNGSACAWQGRGKSSVSSPLPAYMVFGDDHLVSVIAYSVLFVIAALGNLTVFVTLFRNRNRRPRVNMFIMHLSIADMIVTFIMVPMEIGWHAAVYWRAGDVACRFLMFFRTFGFYLSAFILITISLDRYFAILHPLSLHDAEKRGKIMLALAWICSTIASIPQSVIFHVAHHPVHKWFTQCVTMGFFPTTAHELAYNLFNVLALYGVPLVVIVTCYSLILWEVTKKAREGRSNSADQEMLKKRGFVRRSGPGTLEKARVRTLKMTVVIVLVFILCWTPYFVLSAWWWIDKESASTINPKVQRWIFTLAVSNSCMDPIVYGMFTLNLFRDLKKWCCPCMERTTRATQANLMRYYTFRTSDSRSSEEPRELRKRDTSAQTEEQCLTSNSQDLVLISDLQGKSRGLHLQRSLTPPHIAKGMGNKNRNRSILFL